MALARFKSDSEVPARYAEEIEKVGIAMVGGKPPLGYVYTLNGKKFEVTGYATATEFLEAFGEALGIARLVQVLTDGPPLPGTHFARLTPVEVPANEPEPAFVN